MFYTVMILPRVTGTYNPQSELLENFYKHSMRVLKETVDSVHSKTLDELYTDAFRPSQTKSNMTTVKSLKTGEPVNIDLKYKLIQGDNEIDSHRLKYYAYLTNGKSYLGSKTFGIRINPYTNKKEFEGGFIASKQNNDYSGVQIRLLQAACEEANRNGIKSMPLYGLFPAVNFHTMMGFRPVPQCNEEVRSWGDITRALNDARVFWPKAIDENTEPILAKKDGKYFFDLNRTMYCAVVKQNNKALKDGKRHIPLSSLNSDNAIDMELSGEEFDKWIERSKGFEIMPDAGGNPEKRSFKERLLDFINIYRLGG